MLRGKTSSPTTCAARPWSVLLAGAILAASASCGSEPPGLQPPPPSDDGEAGPACLAPGDSYQPGLTKTSASGNLVVELDDADPAPPGLGENKWTLQIRDGSQNPVAGAMVNITLFMPEHVHPQPGTVGTDRGGGTYEVTNLDFTMPGLFNITIEVTTPAGTESALFQFCVARKGD